MPLRTISDSSARHSAAAPRIEVAESSVSCRAVAGLARLCGSQTEMCTTTWGLNAVIVSTMRSCSIGAIEVEVGPVQPPSRRIDVDADELADPRLVLERRRRRATRGHRPSR